ncbi:hypothetical protein R69619_02733 [Paraburkholderia nemoris]|uniref:hypothetical protein n=1 Tax=Paraburkholderia nemoris TaxID=2793076 RepID=UPI00190BE02F|nr:hypothetical protein [Paraburkholderia nemoris]MBK3741181.1 hypothetical protein [Paraburkholderia aspalathi]CAE6746730.1 hypothetical protein R69619_02733 [Paraburkholderia nemoris]
MSKKLFSRAVIAFAMLATAGAHAQSSSDLISGLAGRLASSSGAGYVSYSNGASGSATRTAASKFQDSINSADFAGCDPTGTTDSTTCLNNAIAAAGSKALTIGPGTYKYTALTIGHPITIRGAGLASTILMETSATGDGITVSANQVVIEGIGFNASVTRTAGAFVNMTSGTSQVTLRDFYMTGHFLGVHMTCAAECRVQSGTMYGGATTTGSGGILVDGGNDQYVSQVTMDAPSGSQQWMGIQVTNSGALNFTDLDIIHHGYDLLIDPASGQSVASLYAENSYFDTASYGIFVNPSGTGNVIRLHFIGCWSSSQANAGIQIQPAGTGTTSGIEFIAHHAIGNGSNGALIQAGTAAPTAVKFIGGDFAGNAQNGIAFGAGVGYFSVIGVNAGAYAGVGGNGAWGVIASAGSGDYYTISDTQAVGNTSGGISDGGTGTHKWVKSNLPYTAPANVSQSVGASPWTYTNTSGQYQTAYVNGGTVSVIAVNGGNVFLQSNQSVRVPPNASMTVTYSVAPTVVVGTD